MWTEVLSQAGYDDRVSSWAQTTRDSMVPLKAGEKDSDEASRAQYAIVTTKAVEGR